MKIEVGVAIGRDVITVKINVFPPLIIVFPPVVIRGFFSVQSYCLQVS